VNSRFDGRFMGSSGMTETRRRFVAAFVANGAKATEAARKAGYATPRTDSWKLLRNQTVIEGIRREFAIRVQAEAAPVGLAVLMEVAQDPAQSVSARVSAARALLQLAGHGGKDGGVC
jgi:hypothetical protein